MRKSLNTHYLKDMISSPSIGQRANKDNTDQPFVTLDIRREFQADMENELFMSCYDMNSLMNLRSQTYSEVDLMNQKLKDLESQVQDKYSMLTPQEQTLAIKIRSSSNLGRFKEEIESVKDSQEGSHLPPKEREELKETINIFSPSKKSKDQPFFQDVSKMVSDVEQDITVSLRKQPEILLKQKHIISNFLINSQSKQLLGILKQNSDKCLIRSIQSQQRKREVHHSELKITNNLLSPNPIAGVMPQLNLNQKGYEGIVTLQPQRDNLTSRNQGSQIFKTDTQSKNQRSTFAKLNSNGEQPQMKRQGFETERADPTNQRILNLKVSQNQFEQIRSSKYILPYSKAPNQLDPIQSRGSNQNLAPQNPNAFEEQKSWVNHMIREIISEIEHDSMSSPLKPFERHRLNNFRESAINLEISLELKYTRLAEIKQLIKSQLLQLRRSNHRVQELIREHEEKLSSTTEKISELQTVKKYGLKKAASPFISAAKLQKGATQGAYLNTLYSPAPQIASVPMTPNEKKQKIEDLQTMREDINLALDKLRFEYHSNSHKIQHTTQSNALVKEAVMQTRDFQIQHYETLLETGFDFRLDGLSWIIKTLWHIGLNINLRKLPSFLDIQAQQYLLEISKMEFKVWILQKDLKELIHHEIAFKSRRKPQIIAGSQNTLDSVINKQNQQLTHQAQHFSHKDIRNLKTRIKDKQEIMDRFKEKILASKNTRRQIIKTPSDPNDEKQSKQVNQFFFSLISRELEIDDGTASSTQHNWLTANDFNTNKRDLGQNVDKEQKKPNLILQTLLQYAKRSIDRLKSKQDIEDHILQAKKEIKELRLKEFSRVFKEFHSLKTQTQSYEQKYNTTFDNLLLALFGEKRQRKFQQLAFQERMSKQNNII